MKPIRLLLLRGALVAASLLVSAAQAADWTPRIFGWAGLQLNFTPQQVAAVLGPKLGPPVLVSKTKGGVYETWNYDNGGSVVFVRGALEYWSVPRLAKADLAKPAR